MQIKTQTALVLGFCDDVISPFTGFVLFFTHYYKPLRSDFYSNLLVKVKLCSIRSVQLVLQEGFGSILINPSRLFIIRQDVNVMV